MCAGLRNGAFHVEPRPVFFSHMMGLRAALPARAIVMKALGMWHWEARTCRPHAPHMPNRTSPHWLIRLLCRHDSRRTF